ncbi:MAG: transposase [Saprospiraceae bacterium]|nr:transposase [Saprospiraceae bacterium]
MASQLGGINRILDFPAEIRKLIYTTNIIESFNASLRKYTRNKKYSQMTILL